MKYALYDTDKELFISDTKFGYVECFFAAKQYHTVKDVKKAKENYPDNVVIVES